MADAAARIARAEGSAERIVRVSLGLTPVYVPPIPERVYPCPVCGTGHASPAAVDACCRDYDDG